MEISRRKSLSFPHLLLLLSLLISPLPSWSQAENSKCFVCSSRTTEKCEEALSSLDTEFTKECPNAVDPSTKRLISPSGCFILMLHPVDYVHPRGRYVWRDCLYSTDFDLQLNYVSPNPPWSTGKAEWRQSSPLLNQKSTYLRDFNQRRKSYGLSPIREVDTEEWNIEDVQLVVQYFLHPDPKHWTLSNKAAAKILFPEPYKKPSPMRSVKCFVCTHHDPGCEDELTPSNTHLIQECVGSEETTVPIGCHILVGQFHYPHKTYFYRDCLYQNYLYCYTNPPQPSPPNRPVPEDKWSIYFSARLDCLNNVRRLLGLPEYDTWEFPWWSAKAATLLYVVPGEPEPERFKEKGTKAFTNRGDLSNGLAIEGLISKQPSPPDFKNPGPFSCHTCDTSTEICGVKPGEIIRNLPQHLCKSPHPEAYGCMMIWKQKPEPTPGTGRQFTIEWMRRGCWYKGDLFCLKGLEMPTSSGRSAEDCPPPPGENCNPMENGGKTAYWEGIEGGYQQNEKAHDKLRSCMKNIRQRLGVNDTLPELPGELGLNLSIRYSFCAGRTLCNNKKPDDAQDTVFNATCDPDDERKYPCKCEGDNCDDKKGWPTYVMVLIGVSVALAIIIGMGIGVWLWMTRRERVGPELPVDNHQAVQGDLSQVESKGSKVEVKLKEKEQVAI